MTTIYFSLQDFQHAMRSPHSAERAHAVCRRITGCASQESRWYGAHYYAACALLGRDAEGPLDQRLARWKGAFTHEITHSHEVSLTGGHAALWYLAVDRVNEVLEEALTLQTSMDW